MAMNISGKDILTQTVISTGGKVNASVKVFKDSITSKTTWIATGAVFITELGVLTYQRFYS